MVLLVLISVWVAAVSGGLPPVIRIGAIFTEDQKNSSVELAFKYAVYKINKEREMLPNTTLVYDIQYVPRDDSFRTSKKACRQMEFGVQAIFGPSDPILGAHIQSICEALDVPHIEARVDFEPVSKQLSINLHPSQENMNKAFKDLMAFLNWTKVAIIYEEDYGLFKLQELVKAPGIVKTEMYIRQASPSSYRQVLREVRQKEIFKLIVDTNPKNIQKFFRAILQLQMNDYRYHYMFTTFDLETFDLEDFKYNSVNITAFRLVDVDHPKVKEILAAMQKFQPIGHAILNGTGIIQAEPALMYDSVYVFAKGLATLDSGHSIRPTNLSCDIEKPWDDGLSLYNYLDSVSKLHGLTGNLEFQEGKRSNFKVDLLKLKKEDIKKVGTWSMADGINITDPNAFYDQNAPNITLIVMTREEKPYVMLKEDQNLTGNARYEGFCIDLLKWIAGQVGFQYSIRLVPDNMYGVYNPDTKQWNGIVRELMEKRADLAVASMTINYARESVIDFTKPFMNLGIGILFKVPTSQPTRLFSFMNPLAVEIWIYVLAAYLLVSFTLFVMARFSPYEWNNPHPCHQDSDIVENQFSVSNSFWFITGTFLRQGSGLNPKVYKRVPSNLFSFLTPLAIEIWIFMVAAYILVSLTIWIVARFSPMEWKEMELCDDCLLKKYKDLHQKEHCEHTLMLTASGSDLSSGIGSDRDEDETETEDDLDLKYQETRTFLPDDHYHEEISTLDVLENGFTIGNSFWFAIGSLMQQGSDLNPKATSTRIVGGIWWFFTLIIISSYTANLAAFLTVERMITPIENAQDLADQTEISYGTLEGGSTMTFFRDSKIGIYQKMWRFMENRRPPVFVKSYEDGIARVLQGNYAFLMESTMLDYAVQRDCNLTQIGGLLDSKGYGIATPKGSPWRDKISLAILELQEKGVIQILYDKWWKNTGDVCTRDDKSKESKANALGVENIGGVFVVLLCGLALAILVAILEFCWNSKKNAQTDRQSLCSEMAEELRFAMRCHGSRQRPALRRSCTRCSPATTYVPAALDLPHLNGEGVILPMMDLKKSPVTYDVDT
ncbi:glutamate receptor ionotropic, kainate 2 isoform X1 [Anthonomus grandis grandis]|uniref:glutamate receptor ionotropic, kainate 2 isoform X1 n=1 Tax=Anthonomus grandis grandis TaxID=2921223 RepID=UPI002165E410|nr:glutamate receptor ionotropic, kainate 2 isoform X1 [Anthonomus grandis grandis]